MPFFLQQRGQHGLGSRRWAYTSQGQGRCPPSLGRSEVRGEVLPRGQWLSLESRPGGCP